MTLDLRQNYWGTADSSAIAAAIHDGHDGAQDLRYGFVQFWPALDRPVPLGVGSFGRMKGQYRPSSDRRAP